MSEEKFTVILISSVNCKDCDHMRSVIKKAIKESSFGEEGCGIKEIDSSIAMAIDIAIENGIDDLPACVIGSTSFCGKDGYDYDSILFALEKEWK